MPLTRAGIAGYSGLTLETVSRQTTTLRPAGTLKLDEHREIFGPDIETVQEVAGE